MLENGQRERGDGHGSCVNIHHAQTRLLVIILKEQDHFAQKKRLDNFDCFLYVKERHKCITTLDAIGESLQLQLPTTFLF